MSSDKVRFEKTCTVPLEPKLILRNKLTINFRFYLDMTSLMVQEMSISYGKLVQIPKY